MLSANRLLRSDRRPQEAVLLDLLHRFFDARVARERFPAPRCAGVHRPEAGTWGCAISRTAPQESVTV